jgi:apolipoprotein N-acyltransferase
MRSLFGSLHTPSSFQPLSRHPAGRARLGSGLFWALLCVLGGLLQAASLAWPLQGWSLPGSAPGQPNGGLQIVSLAWLVLALQQSAHWRSAAWRGWLFATAWLAGTFWWLFISMHTYGGLPAWLAVAAVLALAAALSLYYGLAAAALSLWAPVSRAGQALLFAAAWTLAELARGNWFTGFPWGAGGYAQVDLMSAWAPWVGVYGMGFLAALLAYALGSVLSALAGAALAWLSAAGTRSMRHRRDEAAAGGREPLRHAPVALVLLALLWSLWGGGEAWRWAGQRDTQDAGTLRVWLLQGNIAQDEKFEAGTGVAQALAWYPQQIRQAIQLARERPAEAPQLVVAPETALPVLPQQLPAAFWQPLLGALAQPGSPAPVQLLMGLPLGSYASGYTNSAWGLGPTEAAQALGAAGGLADPARAVASSAAPDTPFYRYDKHHLVPFGEFIPPLFRWFTNLMNIPLGDFNRGSLGQVPWAVAGQRIAPNICYEDLFGEELAASFADPLQAPTVLVNVSNIAWFGDSIAIDQHLQASRLRALELGRPMLRATNTGATAVIDHRGEVTQQLPRLTRDRLEATVQGRSGLTPFARWASRWGLWPVWGVCGGLVLLIALTRRRRA